MSLNLKVNSISKIYRSKKVLNNVSFELNKGNILGLIGKNGAGKSTVLKILSSLIDFGGDVLINKKSIKKMDAKSKARRKSFKARHAKNIAKGKMSAAYWADKVKW